MMRPLSRIWRDARPNLSRTGKMAFVALRPDRTPAPAWKPFTALQLIGGRTWTLSLIRSGAVVSPAPGRGPVERELVEEALDLLRGDERDEEAAAAALADALGQ